MAPHPQRLTVTRRGWALARPFTTAHGVKATADVVIAEISDGDGRGRGECVPLTRYGESIDSVVAALDAMKGAVSRGLSARHCSARCRRARRAMRSIARSGTSRRSAPIAASRNSLGSAR
jgi:L-alanine-DL-glutamate epimerase-like enolase superfamily enzyme